MPDGYDGDFAPGLKALVLELHHEEEMTESAIHRFLTTHGIDISTASISRIITDKQASFHQEKRDIVSAGLQSTIHQQMDDTGARVSGKNHYMHILCNDYYTAYFTRKDKTRLTIIDILSRGDVMFHFNECTYSLMEQMEMSEQHPTLPLHNNTSELGARKQARYRDISFHTVSEKGTEANDTFKTIIQTAKKLGVNSYRYLCERISNTLQMPSLAEMILNKANTC